MARNVKSTAHALARTKKPVTMGDGLQNVVAGLGTERDKRSYTTWQMPCVLTRYDLESMYRVSWLSKRIINAVADDMTRAWRHHSLEDDDKNTILEVIAKAEKKLQVKAHFNEALRWARLYGGSLMLLGIRGDSDLSQPLDPTKLGKDCIQFIRVLDRWRVAPDGELDVDLSSDNFGKPLFYLLAESSIRVHHTRFLRFNGEKLPYFSWMQNGMWDDSVLQHTLDSLKNVDTSAASIATMMFEANVDVITSPTLTDTLATRDGEAKVLKRFQTAAMMKSFNRTLMLDGDETYEKKQNQFTNLDKILEKMQVDVCGATEIPMTRLFGQSPGGLNATGDGDLENYYNMIHAKQESEMRVQLDFFDEILFRHATGAPPPEEVTSDFDSLWQMTDAENATIGYNNAQRDQIYLTAGVVTPGLVASELKAEGVYRTMEDEDVQLAEELGQAHQELDMQAKENDVANTDPKNMKKDVPPKKGK